MSKWLEHLRSTGALEERSRRRSKDGVLTPQVATGGAGHELTQCGRLPKWQEDGRHPPANLGDEEGPQQGAGSRGVAVAGELEQAIRQARDWQGLYAVLQRVDAVYQAGQIDQDHSERLAAMAAREAQCLPGEVDDVRLSDLLRENPVRRVRSQLLGEDVLFAADEAEIPHDAGLVVYRESELRLLAGRPRAEVRAIHAAKRSLDGEVVEAPLETTAGPIVEPAPQKTPPSSSGATSEV